MNNFQYWNKSIQIYNNHLINNLIVFLKDRSKVNKLFIGRGNKLVCCKVRLMVVGIVVMVGKICVGELIWGD